MVGYNRAAISLSSGRWDDGIAGAHRTSDYRQVLIRVCRYLKIPYSIKLTTTDLEAEVFLNLLGKAWKQLSTTEQQALTVRVQRSLAQSKLSQPLPLSVQRDPLALLVKGGSALAVTSILKPVLLQQIARQFALHFATYQVARETLIQGGAVAATQFQNYVALQTAQRGMAISAARYGAARGVLAWFRAGAMDLVFC